MSGRIVRAVLTQTANVYAPMPGSVAALPGLAGHLEDLRRANVEHHLGLLAEAAARGARVVGLGELFPAPYFALHRQPFWRDLAEDAEDGPTVTAVRAAAREHGLVVVAPIYELDSSSGRRFDTAVVIDAAGRVLGKYRKTHIPRGRNERGAFHESFYYEPSDGRLGASPANVSTNPFFPVFRTEVGNVGVAICYDRHFEGVMSTLAREGAEIVFSPAVTFGAASERLWRPEFETEAARHRLFIGGSNREGREPPFAIDYFGESLFVGPDGSLQDISDHPQLVIADLDMDRLSRDDPSGWDLARDRRPEIYGKE